MFDQEAIKQQFPILKQRTPQGQRLVYLDNAATCHKPQSVVDAIADFYTKGYSTVGRASYWPASETTRAFNKIRLKVQHLIGAKHQEEVVFTFGTTDGINKVANSFLRPQLNKGDEVIISEMEHHANLLPWQQICEEKEAELKVIPMLDSGELDYEAYDSMLNENVKLVAITGISNALGIKNDLKQVVSKAKAYNIPVFIDAAQSLAHDAVNVSELECDFLVFSGHKLYGPTGIGVLYGKRHLLESMQPLSLGGGIVKRVTVDHSTFQDSPSKHEAGTPNIAGVFGLGAAIDFVNSVGYDQIEAYAHELTVYAIEGLSPIKGLRIIGPTENRAPVVSFVMDGIHPHDLGTFLNEKGICIRAGHHCAQPLMDRLKLTATARASFAIYNTKSDIDALIDALDEANEFFL